MVFLMSILLDFSCEIYMELNVFLPLIISINELIITFIQLFFSVDQTRFFFFLSKKKIKSFFSFFPLLSFFPAQRFLYNPWNQNLHLELVPGQPSRWIETHNHLKMNLKIKINGIFSTNYIYNRYKFSFTKHFLMVDKWN